MRLLCLSAAGLVLALTGFVTGCGRVETAPQVYPMGEKLTLGPLTYNVIENNWYTQLGEGFKVRSPQQRFLAIKVSITNGGGGEIAVPLLTLENSDGKDFVETENGDGLQDWLGILRSVGPAQTIEGKLLFDVPLASYKLRLTDGGGSGQEKYSWVSIPLHIDGDTGVQTPAPGDVTKQ